MRYELTDHEWSAIKPMLPSNARGVPCVNDRRVRNGIFWVCCDPAHRGATCRAASATRDMQRDLGIECPSARITGLRNKGVAVLSIGQRKYRGARPFEM